MSARLRLAVDSHSVPLPPDGTIVVIHPPAEMDMPLAPDRAVLVQPFKPVHAAWAQRGYRCVADLDDVSETPAGAILCLPRAKDAARALLARAAAWGCPLVVDGQKGDGIDSMYKALRQRAEVSPAFSKTHGKCFAVAPGADLSDWALPQLMSIADGWVTSPGIFSSDGPDPGSVALGDALPPLKGTLVDLGAGWGYLSARALAQSDKILALHLVEADHTALIAARQNVTDARARFHWDDATLWRTPDRIDHVITNPPFHTSRRADPALGAAFIASAARLLAPSGSLWLVANRHLPYESALTTHFAEVAPLTDTGAYKLIHARKPRRR